jgi:RNA-directed DNA polymerase
VNTGVPTPEADMAMARVLEMQRKLHRWAGEDGSRRFDDLYNLVHDSATLRCAWKQISGNRGARSAGVDGLTVHRIEKEQGGETFLADLRAELKARTYRPSRVREKMIPKANGKLRRLGIATVRDRVVQAALKLVLEPIFEHDFQPCSYGFRPNRRAQDAIAEIHLFGSHSYEWVLEADIAACFDNISHTALMDRVRRRIKDKRVLALVKALLGAGILTELGGEQETHTGTPQGGILSPLLANIALSALDDDFMREWEGTMNTWNKRWRRRQRGLGSWRLIRYADDFVVMVSGTKENAEALRASISTTLATLGLTLSEEKTRVAHLDDGFDFLGFRIQRRHKRGTNKHVIHTYPARKSTQAARDKVRALTRRSSLTLEQVLSLVNAVVRGWCNYFRHGVSKRIFGSLDYYVWHRVARWIWEHHDKPAWKTLRRRIMPNWKIAAGPTELYNAASTPVTRYRYRGQHIPTPWTQSLSTA